MESSGQVEGQRWVDDSRVETRRYLDALMRNRLLIAVIVVFVTILVLVISSILPKQYSATATIVFDSQSVLLGPPDAEATERQLSTLGTLFTTPRTEAAAAKKVPGETVSSIDSATTVSVAPEANLIHVSATSDDADRAADIANAVSRAFLRVQQELQREQIVATQVGLEEQLEKLTESPGTAEQTAEIRKRINHLEVEAATSGGELQLGEAATAPSSPSSPQPLRNTVVAFFAAIFIGILLALARDQLSPGLSDPREVGRLLRAPVLAAVPYVGRKFGRNRAAAPAVEHEAYQTLSASVQVMLPVSATSPWVVLLTSAVHAEGKSTATARLGRALAQAGHKTLVVSGDLRWPTIHDLFDVPRAPGLTDLLERIGGGEDPSAVVADTIRKIKPSGFGGRQPAPLHLLTSGSETSDPSGLLSSAVTEAFVQFLKQSDYEYVLIDGPPSLGIADVQQLLTQADAVVVVSRLDQIKVGDLVSLQEMLSRLGVEAFGSVVVGANVSVSPYYLGERNRMMVDAPTGDSGG